MTTRQKLAKKRRLTTFARETHPVALAAVTGDVCDVAALVAVITCDGATIQDHGATIQDPIASVPPSSIQLFLWTGFS